ncbi:contact-dependent growth inhibition system immunity protein [Agaribacter flavus]|uniref:Contact-dependent growth inhibition system immunity protein n=1 Tax=Agaribacter flavus TaxID=1902781 RepID=A0ABV7FIR3_9ALTE
MKTKEILENFFQAYFHQDWSFDYSTTLDGVAFFKKNEPESKHREVAKALSELISEPELPQTYFYSMGGEFRPEVEGMKVNQWLRAAIDILQNNN